ncbi:S8 family peptidase [Streptomyces sp. Ag109_O5-10]|uniref:S8 family peptidase n=1 Tax=Streptomyces sp. Ag109_O5-10 TaxID=1855349 RepID=UPI00089D2C72|nr:S8 family peptidase [Streptomyces sp. Ag109_O5-10]SEE54605.1 Peptidase inhibitor I9 [Streptomyces sp. Ag109_O5-10]
MARTYSPRLRLVGGLTAVVTAAVLSAATLPAHAVPEGTVVGAGRAGSVGGSYLVTLKEGIKGASAAGRDVAARYGAKISHTYGTVLNGYAVEASAAQAGRLAADSRVASVVQDSRVRLTRAQRNVQRNPPSWGLDRVDQAGLPLNRSYTSPGSAGAGVTVYVIDTGVRITHTDFGGRASYGWDFVGNDGSAGDGNGHGTHVAGIIAGAGYGVAKKARVVSVRVLDDTGAGTTAQVIAGVDWVTAHARRPAVANLSLGGFHSAQLDTAVRNSIRAGVTYTVAAGNGDVPAARYSPADVPQALTVGATDRTDARAGFSDYGLAVDLFAPGVAITSDSNTSDTARATYSGTSMAAPHVAGAAALFLAGHRGATPAQVAAALIAGAASGKVSDAGHGSPNRLLRVPES